MITKNTTGKTTIILGWCNLCSSLKSTFSIFIDLLSLHHLIHRMFNGLLYLRSQKQSLSILQIKLQSYISSYIISLILTATFYSPTNVFKKRLIISNFKLFNFLPFNISPFKMKWEKLKTDPISSYFNYQLQCFKNHVNVTARTRRKRNTNSNSKIFPESFLHSFINL